MTINPELPATRRVPVTDIVVDTSLWPRRGYDHSRVAMMADLISDEGPQALPPIVLVESPRGLLLADGHHRLRAHRLLGETEVDVMVIQ